MPLIEIVGWQQKTHQNRPHAQSHKLTSITYPSQRQVSYAYDGAGRPQGVTTLLNGQNGNYVSGATYAPHGALSQMTLGGLTETRGYNSLLQPTSVTAMAGSTTQLGLTFNYATPNNGNLSSQTINHGGTTFTQNFLTYDGANRLTAANEGSNWSQSYAYDAQGNRAVVSAGSYVPNSLYTPQVPNAGSTLPYTNNRWAPAGASYDAAGNQLSVTGGAYTFSYDGENRQRRVVQAGSPVITTDYTYDGDGRRVSRTSGSATTVFVYDAAGNLAAEYGTPRRRHHHVRRERPSQRRVFGRRIIWAACGW